MQDDPLDRIRRRLSQFSDGQGYDEILSEEGLSDVAAVLFDADVTASAALALAATFHWSRFLASGSPADVKTALLLASSADSSENLPSPIRKAVLRGDTSLPMFPLEDQGPLATAQQGLTLMGSVMGNYVKPTAGKAIQLIEASINAANGTIRLQCNFMLALALTIEHEHSPQRQTLDRLIEAAEKASQIPLWHPMHADANFSLMNSLAGRFAETMSLDVIDQAIDAGLEAVESCPFERSENRQLFISRLLVAVMGRYEHAQESGDLALAAEIITLLLRPGKSAKEQEVEYALVVLDEIWSAYLSAPSDILLMLAVKLNDLLCSVAIEGISDRLPTEMMEVVSKARAAVSVGASIDALKKAVLLGQKALTLMGVIDPEKHALLHDLAIAYTDIYESEKDLEALGEAIKLCRRSLALIGQNRPSQRGKVLMALQRTLALWYFDTNDLGVLAQSIEVGRKAIDVLAIDDKLWPWAIGTLVVNLSHQYSQTFDRGALAEAVAWGKKGVEVWDVGSDEKLTVCIAYSKSAVLWHELTGEIEHIRIVIPLLREIVTVVQDWHALFNLAGALHALFQYTGDTSLLDEAFAVSRGLVALAIDSDSKMSSYLCMSGLLTSRAKMSSSASDIQTAISNGRSALLIAEESAAPEETLADCLYQIAYAIFLGYQKSRDLGGLAEAIGHLRRSCALAREGSPKHSTVLSVLGMALWALYEENGDLETLDESLRCGRQCLDSPPGNKVTHSMVLANLGIAFRARYERTNELSSLQQAEILLRQSVDVCPDSSELFAQNLSNLSAALLERWYRTREEGLLEEAISVCRRAVDEQIWQSRRHIYLANLAAALGTLCQITGSGETLEESTFYSQQAVDSIEPSHADYPRLVLGLLNSAWQTVRSGKDFLVAENALRTAKSVVDQLDPHHPLLPLLLRGVARTAHGIGVQIMDASMLNEANRLWSSIRSASNAPPEIRIEANAALGRDAIANDRWPEAQTYLEGAVALYPLLVPRQLRSVDQEYRLANSVSLTADAVAVALHNGDLEGAVTLFEQGRNILSTQVMGERADVELLRSKKPDMAGEFDRLRFLLDDGETSYGGLSALPGFESAVGHVIDRAAISSQFEDLVLEIRKVPGFDRFLRPPAVGDLVDTGVDGPVILVNVSSISSDAIVVWRGRVTTISLSELSPRDVRSQLQKFLIAIDAANESEAVVRQAAEESISEVLVWLWQHVAGRVIKAPFLRQAEDGFPARIWWCPAGLLSLLPLHAAGNHASRFGDAPDTVIDHAISSYTTSLRALARSSKASTQSVDSIGTESRQTLMVAMPQTPGSTDLPGVAQEIGLARQWFEPEGFFLLQGADATFESVTAAIRRFGRVHFACHARTDLDSPSASTILLDDCQKRPLTIGDISQLELQKADFAMLSACSSGQSHPRLPDEAIHLASGFQLAGFAQVIATQWAVRDWSAVHVAASVYEGMRSHERDLPGADALHAAVRELRSFWSAYPSIWAAYIHMGV